MKIFQKPKQRKQDRKTLINGFGTEMYIAVRKYKRVTDELV